MVKISERKSEVQIPENVQISLDRYLLKVKGPKGEVERDFSNPRFKIEKKDHSIIVLPSDKKTSKQDKMYINTTVSHIKNMIKGVLEGYQAKLKICSGHFPMSVSTDTKEVLIKNYLGEKVPRKATIIKGVSIKIDGEIITLTGCDIEQVGQAAARIEHACRIKNRDLRLFQDGIWILENK
ncbi:MAG: 50S ribosomal protein L6 [Candidatus Nanoarchaeia archaeon]|nr:50S ribosomal protein L6 [Candidatus Nanoarchaeia archaeon]